MIDSASASDIRVSVLLFARYAELFHADRLDMLMPDRATVGDLIARLRTLPGGESLPASVLAARNLEQVGVGVRLEDLDQIALLPPMSGG